MVEMGCDMELQKGSASNSENLCASGTLEVSERSNVSLPDVLQDAPQEIRVEIPADFTPGKGTLAIRVKNGDDFSFDLHVKVPTQASCGDVLLLSRTSDNDLWSCKLLQRVTEPLAPKEITIFVPAWARPGESVLDVTTGTGPGLALRVPPTARIGDKMIAKFNVSTNLWVTTLIREKLTREARSPSHLPPRLNSAPVQSPPSPQKQQQEFRHLVAMVEAAGGYVSRKLCRGSAPPLNVPGLVALETIEANEELCRIPSNLHFTPTLVEANLPELSAKVDALITPTNRSSRTKQAVLLAQLLHSAELRRCSVTVDATAATRFLDAQGDAVVWKLMDAYADCLLGCDFDDHPYLRAVRDFNDLIRELEPSPLADLVGDQVAEIEDTFTILKESLPDDYLGPAFNNPRAFLMARMCILTRVFQAKSDYTMVPVIDLMNHSHDPGISWLWKQEEDVMVAVATRAHSKGEELLDSYGGRSNVLLYQTYGFTQHPSTEETWNYELRPERVRSIYDSFLDTDSRSRVILFDAQRLDESLISALNEVADNGQSPTDFVSLVCARCKSYYEDDKMLQPAMEALRRVRDKEVRNDAWWQELGEVDEQNNRFETHAIRVKMSEYLCLTAHLEASELADGSRLEAQCFARTATMRELLVDALQALQRGSRLVLKVHPEVP